MRTGLILDLDDTIIDSSSLLELRSSKDWKGCKARFSQTNVLSTFAEVISAIRSRAIPVGIVTASVSFYAAGILRHHNIGYDALIAYHDCSPRKPSPAPIIMCLAKLGCDAQASLGVGDAASDDAAYKAAGLSSWGAGWTPTLARSANWDRVLTSATEILEFF